ncbi:hypothetical protein Gpo141_00005200 [Globisporangium polare]
MWKVVENDEYEAASPAVQAHFHALRTEDALRREDFAVAEREGRLASDRFVQAAAGVASKRTVDALLLLAENYEYRAKVAQARMPQPAQEKTVVVNRGGGGRGLQHAGGKDSAGGGKDRSSRETKDETPDDDTDSASTTTRGFARTASKRSASTGADAHNPAASAAAETQLSLAAAEMEELWRKLQEIGLSSAGSADKNNVLMSSRHLSSSLGDSFCLLPAKTKASVGVHATAIDGGSTLRAAVASRMRNQRLRLMEQQYGQRGIMDDRFHKQQRSSNSPSSRGSSDPHAHGKGNSGNGGADRTSVANVQLDRRNSSSGNGPNSALQSASDIEGLQETVAHQKYEIVRLLNTVKTLSSENTKLLKKCDTLANVQGENKEIQESMEKFKVHYNQKLVMIKRALEEWRRQRNSTSERSVSPSTANQTQGDVAQYEQRNGVLEKKLELQEQQLAQLTESVKAKDEQLAKYEKWYKTLKAGAKAKQRSQSGTGMNGSVGAGGGSSMMSMSGSNSIDSFGGAVPRDSFTSSSFHDYSGASEDALGGGSMNGGRPPAHPNRRAL